MPLSRCHPVFSYPHTGLNAFSPIWRRTTQFARVCRRSTIMGWKPYRTLIWRRLLRIVFNDKGTDQVDAVYIRWHPDCRMKDIAAAAKAMWNGAQVYVASDAVASDAPFFAHCCR
jgi:hypothetical protein